jgi:hypothetical protein
VRTLACAMLMAALSFAGLANVSAQTGPAGNPPPGPPSVNPSPSPSPAAAGMTEADLANYLRSLDPNLTVSRNDKGVIFYRLTVRQPDGWSFTLRIESSKNSLWLDVILGKLPGDIEKMNPAVLAALLQANFKLGPTYFEFAKTKDGVWMNATRRLDRTVSLERAKAELEFLLKQVKESHAIWSAAFTPVS